MAVALTPGPGGLEAATPEALFPTGVLLSTGTNRRQYSVTKDGRRFLVNVPDPDVPWAITVVLNWPAALRPSSVER